MKQFIALFMVLLLAPLAQAKVVYDVYDTSVVNCGGAPHGLWTGRTFGGTCANYFSIQKGTTFTLYNDLEQEDWRAVLYGSAKNPYGKIAQIKLDFSGYLDELTDPFKYKREGGAAYNSLSMDFFSRVEGGIKIDDISYDITNFVSPYTFQYGLGANAKKASEYGASAWIQGKELGSHHWDLNLKLKHADVPEPDTLGLMLLGLLGLAFARKRSATE